MYIRPPWRRGCRRTQAVTKPGRHPKHARTRKHVSARHVATHLLVAQTEASFLAVSTPRAGPTTREKKERPPGTGGLAARPSADGRASRVAA
jgi:hypothetical protein